MASYDGSAAGVLASLSNLVANTGDAAGDTYVAIESIWGSAHADHLVRDGDANRLYGNNGTDRLYGSAGDDILNGGANDDHLFGGTDSDRLIGGAGNDVFVFQTNFGADWITDFSSGIGNDDLLEFRGTFASRSQAYSSARQSGADVIIDYDANNYVTLQNTALASLSVNDFVVV